MSRSRGRLSAELKFEVALAAAKGLKTLNKLSNQFGTYPNQISERKCGLLEHVPNVFCNFRARQQWEQEGLQPELYEQIR